MLGEIALWSFVILLLTGTYLALFFKPSMAPVAYHGSYTKLDGITMSQAYASTLSISFDIRGGLLIRQIHHWAADLFMIAICAHMLRHFFLGSYRKPRDINWLIGIVIFAPCWWRGCSATPCPMTSCRAPGLRIFQGVLQGIPIVGTYIGYFLFGGAYPGPGHRAADVHHPRAADPRAAPGPGDRARLHLLPPEAHRDARAGQLRAQRSGASRSTRTSSSRAPPGSSSSSARWPCWRRSRRSTRSGCTARTPRWRSPPPASPTGTSASWKGRCA